MFPLTNARRIQYLLVCFAGALLTTNFAAEVSLSLREMDATLERIAAHTRDYPPRFSNNTEREQIEKDLRAAIKVLDAAVLEYPDQPELWFRDGYANALGHNLDFAGCDQKFIKAFEQFLKLKPDDRKGNFLYGGFLAGTATRQKDSIPYLEKAIQLGEPGAHYTLAFVYIVQRNKEEAIKHLKAYAEAFPEEAASINAKIENLKQANIVLKHETLPAPK